MPTFLRRLRARIKYWNNAEQLKKELDIHRAMVVDELTSDGTPPREARWRAARQLGNTTLAREEARAVWVARWIEQTIQDTRYALRSMRKEWAFTITSSTTLALGIGVLLGVFTVFNAMFLTPWPVRDAHQVFGVDTAFANPAADQDRGLPSRISYVVWQRLQPQMTTADLAAKHDHLASLKTEAGRRGRGGRFGLVDPEFMTTVGLDFQMGSFEATGDIPGVAISDQVWTTSFGKDPAIVGRRAWIDEHPVVISGVLKPGVSRISARDYDGWVAITPTTSAWLNEGLSKAADILTNPKSCCIEVIGRLREGVTLAKATEELNARTNAIQADFALPQLNAITWRTEGINRPSNARSTIRQVFPLLFLGCGVVTLLACANIGNLQLARGLRRSREIAVRLSLGANRPRVIRQLLTESAAVVALGTLGGLLIAWAVPPVVMSIDRGAGIDTRPNVIVAIVAVAIGALATVLTGMAPALRVTRIDWRGSAAGVAAGAGRLRGTLLGAQIALSLALIASASLLSRGALRAADGHGAGFAVDGIYSFQFALPSDMFDRNQAARAALRAAMVADPTLALGDAVPWQGHQAYFNISVPGRSEKVMAQNAGFNRAAISLMHFHLMSGRWPDDDGHRNEATISRSLATALWQSDDAIGRVFSADHPFDGKAQMTVVGVMDEVRLRDANPGPVVITGLRNDYLPVVFGPPSLGPEIKALAARADSALRVRERPLLAELRSNMEGAFVGISIASGLGLIALLLASFGVFGVFAYIVEERRREIGVRLALGANRSQLRWNVVAATRWPVIGGLVTGLALALTAGFVLRSNLYGLSILDPLSYLAVAVILSLAATAATFVPLRRAIKIDPAITLKAD